MSQSLQADSNLYQWGGCLDLSSFSFSVQRTLGFMSQPSGSVQKCSSDPAASQADLTADGCDLKKKKSKSHLFLAMKKRNLHRTEATRFCWFESSPKIWLTDSRHVHRTVVHVGIGLKTFWKSPQNPSLKISGCEGLIGELFGGIFIYF